VPAYNAAAHLTECLDSALGQCTDNHYEIIVVDDGSTDETADILEEYCGLANFRVIRAANGGVATARNRAIAQARGKYLMFLDSDDQLQENSVDLLVGAAEAHHADIVQGGYFVIDDCGHVIDEVRYEAATEGVPPGGRQLPGYPWGKAIRKSLFEKVRFPDGMDFEDTIFAMVLFPLCGRYVALGDFVYNYRDNPHGMTRRIVHRPSALDAYWIVPVLLEQRERLALPVDENLLDNVQTQFGELLWLRLAGQDQQVVRAVFSAASTVVNVLRDRIAVGSHRPEAHYLDHAFRERRYDLWAYACKFGLQ
jgi:glycosyltransferase involved in cell wall biosynthesis